jgi:23S rRNA (adenine2030-N6)-methyltransferase
MNYRHGFHAGNHADVLKHVVLLAVLDALLAKPKPLSVLDTHAGRGSYPLSGTQSRKTGEADSGVTRLRQAPARVLEVPAIARYLQVVDELAAQAGDADTYPGSPWLIASELRADDRLACCEIQAEEADALRDLLGSDPRVGVHRRDGYEAMHALLPPMPRRGLVLIDPPYETQLAEFDTAMDALKDALSRWPQGSYALWYPIKRRRELHGFFRRAARLQAKSVLCVELLVRADDSPLRLNGSGMLLVNPPWQVDRRIDPALQALRDALGEPGASWRLEWLKPEAP